MKGTLFLIPSPLGNEPLESFLAPLHREIILDLRVFIVEELKSARRYLRKISPTFPIDECGFLILNEHTRDDEFDSMIKPLLEGKDVGLLSEAGVPCIADPGSGIVRIAQSAGISVKPLSGPSSIYLALMASGFNGQNFTFHGYLPIEKHEREKKLRDIEKDSLRHQKTQIFIETPYRNNAMLSSILSACFPGTMLCIAANIGQPDEMIIAKSVKEWKNKMPDLNKKPVVFLIMNYE
jgi:16S rRNA (cytidine1402-2'-O)-methyltransferase